MVLSPGAGIASAAGKKETKGFLMQGASPLAFPGLGGARHGLNLRSKHPTGAYPPALVARPAIVVPDGGLPCWSPADPAISLLCFPLSPCPLPRRGRGRFLVFLCKGLGGARHGLNLRSRRPAGGVPPALAARPAVAVPDGGSPCLSPADPAISLLCFPLSPCPLPRRGRGDFSFLMQGASPLASPGWVGRGTGIACGKPVLSASNGALAPAGAAGTRVVKSPPPVHLYAGSVSAVGGSVQGCRGRSPRQNKLWAPPFPPGRGAGGWGQNQSQRQGRHATSKAIPRKGSCTAGRQASKK